MRQKLRSEFLRRQTMSNDDFEVFYYSDSHFQNVAIHNHNYYEFYFPVKGYIEMEIHKYKTSLKLGDVVIVPPNTMHRALTKNNDKSYCRYVFWISKKYFNQICQRINKKIAIVENTIKKQQYIYHFSENEYAMIQTKLLRLLSEVRNDRYEKEIFIDICIQDLLLTLNRLFYEHEHLHPLNNNTYLFDQIINYIDTHLDEQLSLDKLSEIFYISKYYIAHLFKEHIGMSIHKYITKRRLENCVYGINNGQSIRDVYQDFGFNDYSSFFRAFKKEYSMSPKEYQINILHKTI